MIQKWHKNVQFRLKTTFLDKIRDIEPSNVHVTMAIINQLFLGKT